MFLLYLCKESVFRQEKGRQQPQRLFAALFPWPPTLSLEALPTRVWSSPSDGPEVEGREAQPSPPPPFQLAGGL